jgi:hypothetical protein
MTAMKRILARFSHASRLAQLVEFVATGSALGGAAEFADAAPRATADGSRRVCSSLIRSRVAL